MKPTKGEVWKHTKTQGLYEILDIGKLQVKLEILDMEDCVIYRSLIDQKTWVRPLIDFTEEVTCETGGIKPRFTKIK